MKLSKAVKAQAFLRMGVTGPAGSGKTWTALEVARGLKPAARIAVLDTEMGSASKYADAFDFGCCRWPGRRTGRCPGCRPVPAARPAGFPAGWPRRPHGDAPGSRTER